VTSPGGTAWTVSFQRHPNLCKLLAEFTSAVPDEMFEQPTPVPRGLAVASADVSAVVTAFVL
jgi:hypothetical protein